MASSIGGTFAPRAAEDAIAAPATTVAVVPNGGHFVHVDHPHDVRTIVVNA